MIQISLKEWLHSGENYEFCVIKDVYFKKQPIFFNNIEKNVF